LRLINGGIAKAVAVTAPRIRNPRREIVMVRFLFSLHQGSRGRGWPKRAASVIAGLVKE
jgi:hypothetical protein